MTLVCKIFCMLFIVGTLFTGTLSCARVSGQVTPLSDAEKDAITAHIRNFLGKAKSLRLTPAQLNVINSQKPKYSIYYTGYKRGHMSVRWQLPAYKTLILQRSGDLLGNIRSDWTVRLINDRTSGKLPSNFFGAKGEDISLPQGP